MARVLQTTGSATKSNVQTSTPTPEELRKERDEFCRKAVGPNIFSVKVYRMEVKALLQELPDAVMAALCEHYKVAVPPVVRARQPMLAVT